MELTELLREGDSLKKEIEQKKGRLDEIHAELARAASFKDGTATGHVVGQGIGAKVTLKQNVTYNQTRLLQIKKRLPEEFDSLFKVEYKPVGKRAMDNALAAKDTEIAQAIQWARTVKVAKPSVVIERTDIPEGPLLRGEENA